VCVCVCVCVCVVHARAHTSALTVMIVAIMEKARNALSFRTAFSRSWFGSVLSKVFLISM